MSSLLGSPSTSFHTWFTYMRPFLDAVVPLGYLDFVAFHAYSNNTNPDVSASTVWHLWCIMHVHTHTHIMYVRSPYCFFGYLFPPSDILVMHGGYADTSMVLGSYSLKLGVGGGGGASPLCFLRLCAVYLHSL